MYSKNLIIDGIIFFAFLVVVGAVVWLMTAGQKGNLTYMTDPSKSQPLPLRGKCGHVVSDCKATQVRASAACDELSLRRQIETALADPMQIEECAQAVRQLVHLCPPGCQIDYQSVLVVPGSVKSTKMEKLDDLPQCQMKGERAVTIRANCEPGPVEK